MMKLVILIAVSVALLCAKSVVTSGSDNVMEQPELAKLAQRLRNMRLTSEPLVTMGSPDSVPESTFSDNLVQITPEKSLVSSCSSCSNFVDLLVSATRGKMVLPDAENPSEADEQNREVCDDFTNSEHAHACHSIAQMYGLENIDEFVSAAPDLLCEPLTSCQGEVSSDEATRAFDDVGDILIGADATTSILAGTAQSHDEAETDDRRHGGNNMAKAMKLMMAHRMYSMLNMKMMQDQQMGQQLVHKMMSKLIAAQERNREIKQEYLHFMKQAYRNQPGNCDCCDACLPPKKGGKGKGGRGKKGGKGKRGKK